MPRKVTAYTVRVVPNVVKKFWLRSDENHRESSILKSPAPYGLKLKKKNIFWQITKTFIPLFFLMATLLLIKFSSNGIKIGD